MIDLAKKASDDFGQQCSKYSGSSGSFASKALLADFIQPVDVDIFEGARIVQDDARWRCWKRARGTSWPSSLR
jgi:hypothetical protein